MMVKKNESTENNEKSTQLFVGGLHQGCDICEVKIALSKIGAFNEFTPILDNRNLTRGYAFMTVPSSSVVAFLGKNIQLSNTVIFINKAQKKIDDESYSQRIYFMKDLFSTIPLKSEFVSEYF